MPTGFFQQNFQKHIWDRKSEHHHRIWHIRNSLGIKFHLKLTIFNFWAKLMQNRYFQSKREKKWKSQSNLTYSNFSRFQISALANNFDFLIFFQMKTEKKNEHHHWILHIRISLGNKFYFEKTILIKFHPNGYLQSKTKKSDYHHWIFYIRINLSTKFQRELTILSFSTKFAQKKYFWSKT